MKILVAGFEPFAGDVSNPSQVLLEWLAQRQLPFSLATALLPVSFEKAFTKLNLAIGNEKPDAVVVTGLAKNRPEITVERVGLNWVDARIPDNAGVTLTAQKILTRGKDGIFTRLPIVEMVEACRAKGIDAKLSTSAGEFVCNHVLYLLLHEFPSLPAGFIHLPSNPNFTGVEEMLKVCYHHSIMNK